MSFFIHEPYIGHTNEPYIGDMHLGRTYGCYTLNVRSVNMGRTYGPCIQAKHMWVGQMIFAELLSMLLWEHHHGYLFMLIKNLTGLRSKSVKKTLLLKSVLVNSWNKHSAQFWMLILNLVIARPKAKPHVRKTRESSENWEEPNHRTRVLVPPAYCMRKLPTNNGVHRFWRKCITVGATACKRTPWEHTQYCCAHESKS